MRIVFASLGSLGDLHPILALAHASRDRGHVPVIAASKPYREYIASLGFAFCRIRPDLEPDLPLSEEHLLCKEVFPKVRETYEDLLEAAREADLFVVGELLYVAPMVAAKLAIPWANVILSPSSFLSAWDPSVLAPAPALHGLRHLGVWPHRLIFALGRLVTSRWSAPLRDFRRQLGFPAGPSPVFDGKHSPLLVLALFPRFLAKPQPDWPSQVVQTGFAFFSQFRRPETTEKLDFFLASGEPPIVFTLGSSAVHIAHDFYQSAADAARLVGRRAILLLGKNPSPAALPNRVLAIDYAPLESVLPRAAAVIHHGGIGTCAEALRAGLPSLIVPFDYDQPDNAERLRRLGVSKVLRRSHFSPELLVSYLRDLLADSAMTARAHGLSSRIHPVSDLAESLDAIERLDGSRQTVRPRNRHCRTAAEAAQGMPAAVLEKRDPEVDR